MSAPDTSMCEHEPICYAAVLILANRESNGGLLRQLEAIENPGYGELLARNIMQNEKAWKEEELWKRTKDR
jgi:hypothetical protein